ncbi:phage tail protein [Thiotrichales bacterium 19S3-7]|nr:phage tail protein [Thiotrichales bacterium 19S3-7]MCF6801288.1 phage tail protein [Thiotrichales bacterium 19S3-11]
MKTLTFGEIVFDINHITYQKLNKTLKINWVKQARINQAPILENTGLESETLTISGIVFTNYHNTLDALEQLNDIAISAKPQFLIGLNGLVYGRWVLENITQEITDNINVSYTLSLIRYDSDYKEEM